MSINLLFISLFLLISHVVNSQTCNPTQVTTINNCCVGDLSISTTITSIADIAYQSCGTITSVVIPSTVLTIGFIIIVNYNY